MTAYVGCVPRRRVPALLLAWFVISGAVMAGEPAFIRDLFARHNQERVRHGLEPLRYSAQLGSASQSQAEWMTRGRRPVTDRPEEHLREKPATPQEFRTCDWYPVNRVINAGYYRWDHVFLETQGPDGLVVPPRHGGDRRHHLLVRRVRTAEDVIATGHPVRHPAAAGHPGTGTSVVTWV